MILHITKKYKDAERKTARACQERGEYGKSKCVLETGHSEEYFKVCCPNHCHDGVYVFLHHGGWFVCVKFDRDKWTVCH